MKLMGLTVGAATGNRKGLHSSAAIRFGGCC
jgi:hypothetical protein